MEDAVSRPLWRCEIRLTLTNGQQGVVTLDAVNLVTLREIQGQFTKAMAMAQTLCREEVAEEQPQAKPQFKVV
jgi:hypothetical protein